VYVSDDGVWRGLSPEARDDYRTLAATAFYASAVERGDLVSSEVLGEPLAFGDGVEWAATLRHQRIDVRSYPYEWSFEMLRDAARLQLRLAREALAEQLLTKDASAYNVQFVGAQPTFIDVGSFERLRPGEPWAGYRQFCELFLNPLAIQAVTGAPFQPLLRADLRGIEPAVAAALLGGRGRLQKGLLTHVRLHARADRRFSDTDREHDVRGELERAGFGPKLIDAQLRNLAAAVDALRWEPQASTWSDYAGRTHYTDRDLVAKEAFVAATVRGLGTPHIVLDLGANDGRFSRLAIDAGASYAVAVDSDQVVVDRLYRDLRTSGDRRILPLVLDLANPSPGLGWRSQERASFVARVRPELTLCLAVVHHLALTDNVPFDEIVLFLADFGAPLVVEFPHRDDPMAARLLARKRRELFDHYDRPQWEAALSRRFVVEEQVALPSGTRTLYRCVPRPGVRPAPPGAR
jgi:hypothetical protein